MEERILYRLLNQWCITFGEMSFNVVNKTCPLHFPVSVILFPLNKKTNDN